jgi:hypothetical protein
MIFRIAPGKCARRARADPASPQPATLWPPVSRRTRESISHLQKGRRSGGAADLILDCCRSALGF